MTFILTWSCQTLARELLLAGGALSLSWYEGRRATISPSVHHLSLDLLNDPSPCPSPAFLLLLPRQGGSVDLDIATRCRNLSPLRCFARLSAFRSRVVESRVLAAKAWGHFRLDQHDDAGSFVTRDAARITNDMLDCKVNAQWKGYATHRLLVGS